MLRNEVVRKSIFVVLGLSCLFCTGCATIVTGKYQNIAVTSNPPGVNVRADTGESIQTPGSFNLLRNQDHTLVAEYPGTEPQQVMLKKNLQGWFWGNILLGGIIGGVVDLASGACDKLSPEKVHFDFTAAGQAIATRRNTYINTHPDLTEEEKFAVQHGLAMKGMTKEALIAGMGEPDHVEQNGSYLELHYDGEEKKIYYFKKDKLEKIQ